MFPSSQTSLKRSFLKNFTEGKTEDFLGKRCGIGGVAVMESMLLSMKTSTPLLEGWRRPCWWDRAGTLPPRHGWVFTDLDRVTRAKIHVGGYRRLLLAAGGGLEGSPRRLVGRTKRQEIVIINKSLALRDTESLFSWSTTKTSGRSKETQLTFTPELG